jgi:hypothetical protein
MAEQSAISVQPSAPRGGDVRDFRDLAAWKMAPDDLRARVVEVKKMITALHRKLTADGG